VHFDLDLVMKLLAHHIALNRTPGQRYIMIEGLCNASRLLHADDKMELRLMDELFTIEKYIGEVQGVIGLQFNAEKEHLDQDDIEWEKFDEPVHAKEEVKAAAESEEGDQPPPEEPKKNLNAFRPEAWKWTATNRKPKNLPQVFLETKGLIVRHLPHSFSAFPPGEEPANIKAILERNKIAKESHEFKSAEQYSASQYEAISKSLDEFANRIIKFNVEEHTNGG